MKPGTNASQQQLEKLYFKQGFGAQNPGKRINPSKNNSSVERVFGLDMPKTHYVPGSRALAEPFGKRQYSRGKGAASHQGVNLINGQYGQDPMHPSERNIKPYSKQMQHPPLGIAKS